MARHIEQDERAARAARLDAVAGEIAAAWGNEWTARKPEHSDDWKGTILLCHKSDSRVVVLNVRLYEPVAKIDVHGRYVTGPSYLGLVGLKSNVRPSISVSLDRPGAALAKDIARRFLPDYTRVFGEIAAAVIAHQAAWDSKARLTERLGAVARAKAVYPAEWRGAFVDGRVWNQGAGLVVDLKVDNLTESQAAEVIRLVNSFKEVK